MDDASTVDWDAVLAAVDHHGAAGAGHLLQPGTCDDLIGMFADEVMFRSTVVMDRHGFGSGTYRYFDYPLPAPLATLRSQLYAALVPLANSWAERLSLPSYPSAHDEYLARCHEAGQHRPTPLLLCYGPGDYNRLHRDLYGPLVFPLQVVVQLSRPGIDFTGGEFVVVENQPRMQARPLVLQPGQGEAVVFAVNERPVQSSRGWARASMRHGVSEVRSGDRFTLGIIFHDAA